jgi:hypothetical protein
MDCLDRNSLYSTLDSISESLFFQSLIPQSQRVAAARWIAARQGLPGSYAGMFAPTDQPEEIRFGGKFRCQAQGRCGPTTPRTV